MIKSVAFPLVLDAEVSNSRTKAGDVCDNTPSESSEDTGCWLFCDGDTTAEDPNALLLFSEEVEALTARVALDMAIAASNSSPI